MFLKKIVVCLVFVASLVTCKSTGGDRKKFCDYDCKHEDKMNQVCISQKMYLKERDLAEMECFSDPNTEKCYWFRSNKVEESGGWRWSPWEKHSTNPVGNGCKLAPKVEDHQHSVYKCDSLTKDNTHQACQAFLVVNTVPPSPPVLVGGNRIPLDEGSPSSHLTCKVEEKGLPPVKSFQWFIGGKDFSSMAILKSDGHSEINATKIKDLYRYNKKKVMCRIEHPSNMDQSSVNATLSITYKPRIVDLQDSYSAREDSAISVPLLVASNPPLQSIFVRFSSGSKTFKIVPNDDKTNSDITYQLVQLKKMPGNPTDYTRYRLKISSVTEKVAGTEFTVIMNNRKEEKYQVEETFKVVLDSSLSPLHIGLIVVAAILILIAIIIIIVCYKKRRHHCGKKNGWSAWGQHDINNSCELQGNTNRTLEENRRGDHLSNGVAEHEDDVMLKNATCQVIIKCVLLEEYSSR